MNARLVIRAEQMNAFRRQLSAGLAQRLAENLALLYPDQTSGLSTEALTRLAASAVTSGRTHGILSEDHLLHLLEFFLHYGPLFGDPIATPWAARILQLPNLTPEEKLILLDAHELFGEGRQSA